MSTFERSIVSIIDPKLKVDRIEQSDTESKDARDSGGDVVPEGTSTKNSSRLGAYMPLIVINTTRFDSDNILNMVLDTTNKIPQLSVSFSDPNGKLALDAPTDGDVISLYLRAPDEDNQKPIRIDFDITDISGSPEGSIYSISGIMKIPGLLAEKCKDFPKASSFDHLQKVCEDLQIGFASNETATDDQMHRLCAFDTYHHFVEKTVDYSYKDDDSFFTWYIDPYYYLCLVNVNKQFSTEDKTEDINISQVSPPSGMNNEDKTKDSIKGSLILTNRNDRVGTNIYINNWALDNKSASVWIKQGYKKHSQYFDIGDDNETEYVSTFVDPLTTKGVENDLILPKGRKGDESYKDQMKYKWLGKQSNENVHDNYIFSRLLNNQNLQELNKTKLEIDLAGMNFYIYKYMRIPVEIYEGANKGPERIEKLKDRDTSIGDDAGYDAPPNNDEELEGGRPGGIKPTKETIGGDPRDQVKNEQLSGYYVVNSINYVYQQPGPIKMKLSLIRREWPIPAKNNNK